MAHCSRALFALVSLFSLLSLGTASAAVPGVSSHHAVEILPRRLPYPHPRNPLARRVVQPQHLYPRNGLPTKVLEPTNDVDASFDINWGVQNQPLFSAEWGAGIGGIPVAPGVTVGGEGKVSLALECIDCRTFGTIYADFNDEKPTDLSVSLTFRNVGVYMEFGMEVSAEGTFTIGLGKAMVGNPRNVPGRVLTAGFNIGLELVLQVTGDVKASGGFYLTIPDGQQIGLGIGIDLNPVDDNGLIPKFNGRLEAFPKVDFGLLPVKMGDASVNITAALRLVSEIGVAGQIPPAVQVNAAAGAHLNIVQVKLGTARKVEAPANATKAEPECKNPLFVELESGAGAFVEVGGAIGDKSKSFAPSVTTAFYRVGATTCLASETPSFVSTSIKTIAASASGAEGPCPTAMLSETKNITTSYSMTSCAVSMIACPPSLTQVVVVTDVAQVIQTRCPVNVTATSTGGPKPTTLARIAGPGSGTETGLPPLTTSALIRLEQIQSPAAVTPTVAANVTRPANATISGVFLPITVPPPPPPPAPNTTQPGGPGVNGIANPGGQPNGAGRHASSLALVFGFMVAVFFL